MADELGHGQVVRAAPHKAGSRSGCHALMRADACYHGRLAGAARRSRPHSSAPPSPGATMASGRAATSLVPGRHRTPQSWPARPRPRAPHAVSSLAGPVWSGCQPACHAASRCLSSPRRASFPVASSKSARATGASTVIWTTSRATSVCRDGAPARRPELSIQTITVVPALPSSPAGTLPMRPDPSGAVHRHAPGIRARPGA